MLRTAEHYVSVQGEGPRTGVLTQFIRFGGCNMRCPGWPCDTPHAIFPDQVVLLPKKDVDETTRRAFELRRDTGASNACLTGGEPFVQKHIELMDLLTRLIDLGFTVEVFTNGSFIIPPMFLEYSQIMMDWKLTGSGEAMSHRAEREANAIRLKETDGIKFVCKDTADMGEALVLTSMLQGLGARAQFWVGAAWDRLDNASIVDFIKDHALPWRLNVQTHKFIWHPTMTGV